MIKRIFVDMDGVIADFDKRYFELFQVRSHYLKEVGRIEEYDRNWNRFVNEWHFGTLEYYEGAEQLIQFLNTLNVEKCILSSSSNFDQHLDIFQQKSFWLVSRKINWSPVIVPGKKYKKAFAEPCSLLIDDTLTNVNDFRNFGGGAILHENAEKTIKEVQKLLENSKETPELQLS